MRTKHAPPRKNWWFNATLSMGCVLAAAAAIAADDSASAVASAVADSRTTYAADLEKLAQWCEANGLAAEAKKTRRLIGPSDPYKLYVPILPDEVGPPALPSDAPKNLVEWNARLGKLRHDRAAALFESARGAIHSGQAGKAFDLAIGSLQADPDFEPARRVFGFQKYDGQWRTAYEVRRLKAGYVWNEKFGWLLKGHLRRYEAGERFCDGRWISANVNARRHSDIRSGWTVETEHYSIRTNHSIEAAVSLGEKLERLYRVWRQLFVRYYASPADVAAMFEGRAKAGPSGQRRHEVWFFRDRDDYNRSLRALMPNIGISIGVYHDDSRRAYFFAGDDDRDRTLYHEATHQLFHESRPVAPNAGRKGNFWIVEGIAMFMESLRREDGYYVLGGFDDLRLHAAKYRWMHDHFFVPFDQLVDYDMDRLQKDPRIATLYSQAAGMTHFLIFFDGGRYRDALAAYLALVYAGRDDHDALAKLTGAGYNDLDKQYQNSSKRETDDRPTLETGGDELRRGERATPRGGGAAVRRHRAAQPPSALRHRHDRKQRLRREDLRGGPPPRCESHPAADGALRHAKQPVAVPFRHEPVSLHAGRHRP